MIAPRSSPSAEPTPHTVVTAYVVVEHTITIGRTAHHIQLVRRWKARERR